MGALRNPRHERFALAYFATGIARRAYQQAGYSARQSDTVECAPADACASRLLKHAKVQSRLQEIAVAHAQVTEQSLLEELEQARIVAEANAQSGAMVAATMGKARITGHIVDRKEVGKPGDFEQMTESELREYIAKHMPDSNQDRQPSDRAENGEEVREPLPVATHDEPGGVQ